MAWGGKKLKRIRQSFGNGESVIDLTNMERKILVEMFATFKEKVFPYTSTMNVKNGKVEDFEVIFSSLREALQQANQFVIENRLMYVGYCGQIKKRSWSYYRSSYSKPVVKVAGMVPITDERLIELAKQDYDVAYDKERKRAAIRAKERAEAKKIKDKARKQEAKNLLQTLSLADIQKIAGIAKQATKQPRKGTSK
jgi:hypothetical protein